MVKVADHNAYEAGRLSPPSPGFWTLLLAAATFAALAARLVKWV